MDNPVLTLYPQSICWLCEQHFKIKEKVSTITSVNFKTHKEYAKKKWTAVEKFHLVFKIFISFLTNAIKLQLNHYKMKQLNVNPSTDAISQMTQN